jgi:hypothetical protein
MGHEARSIRSKKELCQRAGFAGGQKRIISGSVAQDIFSLLKNGKRWVGCYNWVRRAAHQDVVACRHNSLWSLLRIAFAVTIGAFDSDSPGGSGPSATP